jgi:hypothetical protein
MKELIEALAKTDDPVVIKELLDNYEPPKPTKFYVCDGDLKQNGGKELVIKTEDHDEFEKAYKKAIKSGKFLIVRKYVVEEQV